MDKINSELRTKLRQDPHSVLDYVSKDIDIVVKTNSKKTIYVVIPNAGSNMQNLSQINAAGTVSTAGSAGSVATLSSVIACFGTVSTLGSLATAGSADTDVAGISI